MSTWLPLAGACAVLVLLMTSCNAAGSRRDSTSSVSCDKLLDRTFSLIRAGQRGNGHDELTAAIEDLRTSGCSKQYRTFADYSSGRAMTEATGRGPCSELAGYIQPAAIAELSRDNFCTGRRSRSPNVATENGPSHRGIPWDQARNHVGTKQRVCGPLVGTGSSTDDVFLNVGRDYPDPQRFTIVLWDVGAVKAPARGATVCVSGSISLYQGVAQVELRSMDSVAVHE